eukprot:jgi/Ulvmu1/4857/UM020_0143.1
MWKPTKENLIGSYDYGWLCMPTWPFGKHRAGRPPPPFFPVDARPGLIVAILMGLQHALAMVGGVITPPLLVYRVTVPDEEKDADIEQYMISAALIVSGITSLIQVTRFSIRAPSFYHAERIFLGTGLVSLMGTSFTFLPIAQTSIRTMIANDGDTWREAYGRVLGTVMLASLLEIFLSFVPPRTLKRLFPPVVTGTAVFLIGASLVGTGVKYWGGGVFCAENTFGLPPSSIDCYDEAGALQPEGSCFGPQIVPDCNGNGEVELPYGSAEYMGLGFSVFATLVLVELFGSPAMRNVQVVIGLLVGYIIAAIAPLDGKHFVTSEKLDDAPGITFLFVETFPLGIYGPGVLPLLIAFIVTTVESIGDITATADASQLPIEGEELHQRVQGGLLGDGLSSLVAALFTSMPNTTFSQNNGVISLTRCASRHAGIAAACWLLLLGIFAKVAAFFTSIPDCVLGGMTTFLFASVLVSGIRIMNSGENGIGRRERFILAVSLGAGLGVTLIPQWTQNNLWPEKDSMSDTLRGFRDAVIITLSTGYSLGVLLAMALNLLLPLDGKEVVLAELESSVHAEDGKMSPDTDDKPEKV